MRVPQPTAVAAFCALAIAVVGGSAHAGELTVCSSDCDYTSIQEAVDNAAAGDTLLLGSETFYESVWVDKDLTIRGAGPEETFVDGSRTTGGWSVFVILGDGLTSVTLAAMTIQNGSSSFLGGGVLHGAGRLEIEHCHILDNRARDPGTIGSWGGGVYSFGDLHISNSVISGNRADCGAGVATNPYAGVATDSYSAPPIGPIEIRNSTISGNRGTGGLYIVLPGQSVAISDSTIANNFASGIWGFGVYVNQATGIAITSSTITENEGGLYLRYPIPTVLQNTIVAGNRNAQCSGHEPISEGHNLSSDSSCGFTMRTDMENTNPLLLPLADNGGPTPTCALHPSSPAIDAGGRDCPSTDQRGMSRPYDGDNHGPALCDIGAFEYRPVLMSVQRID